MFYNPEYRLSLWISHVKLKRTCIFFSHLGKVINVHYPNTLIFLFRSSSKNYWKVNINAFQYNFRCVYFTFNIQLLFHVCFVIRYIHICELYIFLDNWHFYNFIMLLLNSCVSLFCSKLYMISKKTKVLPPKYMLLGILILSWLFLRSKRLRKDFWPSPISCLK